MKKIVFIVFVLIASFCYSQEPSPQVGNDKNWVSSISYDLSGQTLSKGVSYFNDLGKATQSQSWDVLTNRVWASEVRYDSFGRPVLGTLSAPINQTGLFSYKSDFIRSNNSPIGLSQYDSPTTLFNPPAISSDANTLGWYYSSSNTLDPYQDVTQYPYTRTIYSELNPGAVRAVLGGNKINNEWKQTYSFTMVAEHPTNSNSYYDFYHGKKVMKTVSRDVHGVESVVYVDTDGNVLGAARSGTDLNGSYTNRLVYSEVLDKGYVDIHISGNDGITIENYNASNHHIKIYDLITEQDVTATYPTNGTTTYTLPQGFYRIEDTNNYYGTNSSATPLKIKHNVSYYDLSYNEYDLTGRLLKTVQPIQGVGTPIVSQEEQSSTFKYNSFGQLLETTSVDEGRSQFAYRKDGQIRFSQNTEQAKNHHFSYTNYDVLGRPVESGVYKGSQIYSFVDLYALGNEPAPVYTLFSSIVDELDGFDQNDRHEQNFSVYDVADTELAARLVSCGIPSPEYQQHFLSGNVSYTYTENPRTNKTWYSYDGYGRVTWMVQDPQGLGCVKTINYEYDAITGQLIMVDYQRYNTSERFVHHYTYNKAGQLVDVHTSLDGVTKLLQAHYEYNESGAQVRTELATDLQGIDYVYNLSGQLKAINHPSLQAANDPGNDGANGFAADVFGMQLDYYTGDYTRGNTPKPIATTPQGVNQYNGNIKATRWNTQLPSTTQNAYLYEYNKNNWLSQATFGQANPSASITPNPNNDYQVSNITYDANGNIKTLQRKGYTDAAGDNKMDDFTYAYDPNKKNRLSYVEDEEDNSDPNRYNDLRNQFIANPPFSSNAPIQNQNYVYNELGQLVTDLQGGVSYEYNASGLVNKINGFSANTSANLATLYFKNYTLLQSALLANQTEWRRITTSLSTLIPSKLKSRTPFLGCGMLNITDPLVDDFGDNVFLEILGVDGTIVQSKYKIAQNAFNTIDFDLLINKKLNIPSTGTSGSGGNLGTLNSPEQNGQDIIPTLVVSFKTPDGTLISTQTINDQPAAYCGQYFKADVHFDYTATNEEYITVEIQSSYQLVNGGTAASNEVQQYYIDNIHVQAAIETKVAFEYNDRGHRSKKISYQGQNTTVTTYVRDASGTAMAVHEATSGPLVRTQPTIEHGVYGNGRIGVFKRDSRNRDGGYTLYEVTDHLGNVRAVIRKVGTALVSLTSKTDYYPFGMPMPNRQTTDNNYRYAFQGQEKDPETGMEAFELRLWDGRLGRWLTVDPMGQHFSPYLGMGNNPINRIDPNGGWDDPPTEAGTEFGQEYLDFDNGVSYVWDNEKWSINSFRLKDNVITGTSNSSNFSMSLPYPLYLIPIMMQNLEDNRSGSISFGNGPMGKDTDYGAKRGKDGVRYPTMDDNIAAPFGAGGAKLNGWLHKTNTVVNTVSSGRDVVAGTTGGYQTATAIGLGDDKDNRIIIDTIHFSVWSEGEINYYHRVKNKEQVDSINRVDGHKAIHKMEFIYE